MGLGPIDDIAKLILKQLSNKGNQKARYDLLQKTKNIATTGSSKIGSKPKPKVKPKPKTAPKPKGTGTVSGKPVGKIARTTPARPAIDRFPKGKTVPQTASEQRAAERLANRMLRQSGLKPEVKPPTRGGKPVDVRGSIIQPPSKATMRPPKPSKSSFEADKAKGEIRGDRDLFRGGQKPPKGKGKPPKPPKPPKGGAGGVKAKPKPKTPSGAGGATATARSLRADVAAAKTPAERQAAQKKLMNHILSTGGRRSKNIYK